MAMVVVAEPADEFEAWLAAQSEPASPPATAAAERGRELFVGAACARCHTIAGTGATGERGPDLTHLASRATLAAGTLENTPEHLRTWLQDPHAVKPGIAMPDPEPPEQLEAPVAYLEGME